MNAQTKHDGDEHKGAVEDDSPHQRGQADDSNVSRAGAFPHRSEDKRYNEIAEDGDSDFPEPGGNPEHS